MANTKIKNTVLDSSVISGQSTVTAASDDLVLIQDVSDSNNLKKALVSDFGGGVDGISTSADATAITISSSEEVTFSKPTTSDGHTSSVPTIFESSGNGDTVPVQLKVKANNGTTSTQGLYGNAGSASTDNTIVLGNSGSSGLVVDSSGRVIVGQASSTSAESFGTNGVAEFVGSSSGVLTALRLSNTNTVSSGTASTALVFGAHTNGARDNAAVVVQNTANGGDAMELQLHVRDASNTIQKRFTIDAAGQAKFSGSGNLVTFDATSGVTYLKFAENGTSRFFLATLNGSDGLAFVDADGGSTRMKIFDDGDVGLGGAETGNIINSSSGVGFYHERGADTIVGRNGGAALSVLRQSSDGELIRFKQAGSQEGSINVSGSTVSLQGFTGTHETSGIADDTAIGTVVSTIDELDTYVSGSKDGQTRAEHPKVKVSDSVGDSRVYGVLQSRTESDNKPLIASVGLGTILVTGACSGGDLLESNGDGTAKVQDDDIIRSKTIGKVTIGGSNTGVKSVSCVLYCG